MDLDLTNILINLQNWAQIYFSEKSALQSVNKTNTRLFNTHYYTQ